MSAENETQITEPLFPATRISKQRNYWFIYIPEVVKEKLENQGFKNKDIVLWKVEAINPEFAEIKLIFTKENKKVYKLVKP